MRILWFCLIFGSAQTSFAFSEGLGMPFALGLTQTGLWSAKSNPAALCGLETANVGFASAKPFLIPEVSVGNIAAAVPFRDLAVAGIAYAYEGTKDYRTTSASLMMAKQFAKKLSFGMSLKYLQTALGMDYGASHSMAVDMGLQVTLQRELTLGMYLSNPTGAKRGALYSERYATLLSTGLGYRFSDKLVVSAACRKMLAESAQLLAALAYNPTKNLRIRAGVEGGQGIFSFGIGYLFKNWELDLASTMHPQLGQSPQVSISYSYSKQKHAPACID